jgi:hypothetical protein
MHPLGNLMASSSLVTWKETAKDSFRQCMLLWDTRRSHVVREIHG